MCKAIVVVVCVCVREREIALSLSLLLHERCKTNTRWPLIYVYLSVAMAYRPGIWYTRLSQSQNHPYNSERWITWLVDAMKTIAKCENGSEPSLYALSSSYHMSNAHCAPPSGRLNNLQTKACALEQRQMCGLRATAGEPGAQARAFQPLVSSQADPMVGHS